MQTSWDILCQADSLERFIYLLVLHNHAPGVIIHVVTKQFPVAREFAVNAYTVRTKFRTLDSVFWTVACYKVGACYALVGDGNEQQE